MVTCGLALGLATGGFPAYTQEISQAALLVAMTASLTEISFRRIVPKEELRGFLLSAVMSYGVLGGLVLAYAAATPEPALRGGWVLMAAVPPAVAVVPITSLLRGDVRRSLLSMALLYLLGLASVPLITLAFLGQAVPIDALVVQTFLLIGLPIAASLPLRTVRNMAEWRPTVVGVSFFVLVLAIAGSTRDALLRRPDLLASLSALALLRTFGLGLLLFVATAALKARREDRIAATTFSSFKNLGLTVVLAFSFLGPEATLPAIVSLVFEIAWIAVLPLLFRAGSPETMAEATQE